MAPNSVQPYHLPLFFSFSTENEPFTCIFPLSRQGFRRCSSHTSKADRAESSNLRQKILSSGNQDHKQEIEETLKNYARLCCCRRHHRPELDRIPGLLDNLAKRWVDEIEQNRAIQRSNRSSSFEHVKKESFSLPILREVLENTGSTAYANNPSHEGPVATRTRSRTNHLIGEEGAAYSHGRDLATSEAIPHFVPYKTRPDKSLRQVLRRPLLQTEKQTGGIYLFTRACDPGLVKIGYTNNLNQRMSAWQGKCNYKPRVVYKIENLPHARRVENIIQNVLWKERRRESKCRNYPFCTTQHIEWFEIEIAAACAVIDKWASWMKIQAPYDANGQLKLEWNSDKALDQLIGGSWHATPLNRLAAVVNTERGNQLNETIPECERVSQEVCLTDKNSTILSSDKVSTSIPSGTSTDPISPSMNLDQQLLLLDTLSRALLKVQALVNFSSSVTGPVDISLGEQCRTAFESSFEALATLRSPLNVSESRTSAVICV